MLYQAFMQTIELWVFLGILGVAVAAEDFYKFMQRRAETQQMIINMTIDRLHK